MCGIAGYLDLEERRPAEREVLGRMTERLRHRGPDASGFFTAEGVGLGFQRLAIIDLEGGHQPMFNEDRSIALVCNGEIFNYKALREELTARGHLLRTRSDVEVLVHLYEEHGADMFTRLNGQFAIALYDLRARRLLLARDHAGVIPLYYTVAGGQLLFASEIKALLAHPAAAARARVDLSGLDQVFLFPGLVSPRTMFEGIHSLEPGHYLDVRPPRVEKVEYWDLIYPEEGEVSHDKPEHAYVEQLREHLERSVALRLQADVPVGFYLSGGLDSSLIASLIRASAPSAERHSFSMTFVDRSISESRYQRLMARHVGSIHHELVFDTGDIAETLGEAVYHSECALKETYNTASLALSRSARQSGVPVILTGEGADELFAGYVGYRFDQAHAAGSARYGLEAALEEEARERLWGDPGLFYERDYHAFSESVRELYSDGVNELLDASGGREHAPVNKERLRNRHLVHQRAYIDWKLRLTDHLVADHGDRMAMANAVEARYPFLDVELVRFSTQVPPSLKVHRLIEKYILKQVAHGLLPDEIIHREKFGFIAPGSPALVRSSHEWVGDMLSYERLRRQGYWNPEVISRLAEQYAAPGFSLNLPFDSDLLIIVLTFNLLLERFGLPDL